MSNVWRWENELTAGSPQTKDTENRSIRRVATVSIISYDCLAQVIFCSICWWENQAAIERHIFVGSKGWVKDLHAEQIPVVNTHCYFFIKSCSRQYILPCYSLWVSSSYDRYTLRRSQLHEVFNINNFSQQHYVLAGVCLLLRGVSKEKMGVWES